MECRKAFEAETKWDELMGSGTVFGVASSKGEARPRLAALNIRVIESEE
jgi:hypothetical protein